VNTLLFRRMEGRTEDLHPPGDNFTPGGQRGEFKNRPLEFL
jgi:hypothetical protein